MELLTTNEVVHVVKEALKSDPITGNALTWITLIQACFGALITALTVWLKFKIDKSTADSLAAARQTAASTEEIHKSVNSRQDKMILKDEALTDKVSALEEAIKRLLVERAAGATVIPVTVSELQSEEPLKP